jgi:hypothetical protein
LTTALVAGALFASGCGKAGSEAADATPTKPPPPHTHAAGRHGGKVADVFKKYHVEGVFRKTDTDFSFDLYVLDEDPNKSMQVPVRKLQGELTAMEGNPAPITLEARPFANDASGKTSRFTATLPIALANQDLELKFDYLLMEGANELRQPVHFTYAGGAQRAAAEELKLFTTAGGLYTAKDIAANGKTTPRIKFKDIHWPHDNETIKVGDRICPVTDNKADSRCAWVVDGKKYTFCCDPCVRKFVRWAKAPDDLGSGVRLSPKRLKEPDDYRATEEIVRRLLRGP